MKLKSILLLSVLLIVSSCMESISPEGGLNSGNLADDAYAGCLTATPLDTTTISVNFDFPSNASQVEVYRDGLKVLVNNNPTNTTFVDTGLEEGAEYTYECLAKIGKKYSVGSNKVTSNTVSVNPPLFGGIQSAVSLSSNQIRVNWTASTGGSKVKYYNVYAAMVNSVDFTLVKEKIDVGNFTTVLENLADDMPYKLAVRACSVTDVCDTNTIEIDVTTPDGGVPSTLGSTSATIVDSKVNLSIPWQESQGAVSKRRIYRSTNSDGSGAIQIGVIDVNAVSDLSSPSTTYEDAFVLENTTYYYYVLDEDPSGNTVSFSSATLLQVDVGDLTSPIFTGLTGIAYGANEERQVFLQFTAIDDEGVDPAGATNYLLYQSYSDGGTPTDPCTTGTLIRTIPTNLFTGGVSSTVSVTGLSSRRSYSYCMQAQDAAGNLSANNATQSITMKDLTPPTFDGIQSLSYDTGTEKFQIIWNASISSDVKNYKVYLWKNTATPSGGDITTLSKVAASFSTGMVFDTADFTYNDGDTVYALVDACDNAGPPSSYNTSDNCTTYALNTAKSVAIADQTPPPFLGTGLAVTDQGGDGNLRISWSTPGDLSDFAGFKVYDISSGIKNLVKNCACSAATCPSGSEASLCDLTGLSSYREYKFFVSAYDVLGNETHATTAVALLNPFIVHKTDDETTPSFISNLSLNINAGNAELAWDVASDNQYAVGNNITYTLYRKQMTNFANILTPEVDGILLYTGTTNAFNDPITAWNPGDEYYFVVCAQDQYGVDNGPLVNRVCSGNINRSIADNVAPTIASVSIDGAINASTWTLKAQITDNVEPEGNISVTVYRKYSDLAVDTATDMDTQATVVASQPGVFDVLVDNPATDLGDHHYVHYLIHAVDPEGNLQTATISSLRAKPYFTSGEHSSHQYTYNTDMCAEDSASCSVTTGGASEQVNPGIGLSELIVTISVSPTNGTLSNCAGLNGSPLSDDTCDYTPNADYHGSDTFTLKYSDSLFDENLTRQWTITVNNVNDAPVLADNLVHTVMWSAGSSAVIDFKNGMVDTDGVGETFSYTAASATATVAGRTIDLDCSAVTSCVVNFANAAEFLVERRYGEFDVNFTVDDGNGGSDSASAKIKVYTPYTWTGNGGDLLASNGANWCGSLSSSIGGTCQGAATGPITGGENIIFSEFCETNCSNPTINFNVNTSPKSLDITENFGTISINSTNTISAYDCSYSRVFVRDGSTLDMTNANASSINELFISDTSTFTAPSNLSLGCQASNYLDQSAVVNYLGDGFNANNGKVTIYAPNSASGYTNVDFGNISFYDLDINSSRSDSSVKFISTNQKRVTNDLNLIRGIFDLDNASNVEEQITVSGNSSFQYVSGTNFSTFSNGTLILDGTAKTVDVQVGVTPFPITIDGGASISTLTTNDMYVDHFHINSGTFTSTSGTLFVQSEKSANSGSFAYSNFTDDGNIRGMIVDTLGTFIHNNGTVHFKDSKKAGGEPTFQVGLYAKPVTTFNNLIIDIDDVSGSTDGSTYHRNEDVDGVMLLRKGTQLRVDGTLSHVNGSFLGGVIDLRGNYEATCVGGLGGDCATGGSVEVQFNQIGQTLTTTGYASTSVITINNGGTYSPAAFNGSYGGLRILNGVFNAPATSMRIGSERSLDQALASTIMAEDPNVSEIIFEVGATGTFNHNNGSVKFQGFSKTASSSYPQVNTYNLIIVDNTTSFYDLEFDVWTSTGARFCMDVQSGGRVVVENNFIFGLQCSRYGYFDLYGDVHFERANADIHGSVRAHNFSRFYFKGSATQNITRSASDSLGSAFAANQFRWYMEKGGAGSVEILSDFSDYPTIGPLTFTDNDTVNVNANSLSFASVSGTGTLNN